MKMKAIKAAPAASAIALKNEKSAKAKRILIGTDVHLRGYQAARKIDNGVIGVVENFGSEGQRPTIEPGLWELEQLVAPEGLDPIELPSAAMAAGEAQDLGRCAQDAR